MNKHPRYRKTDVNKIAGDIKTEESIQSSQRCHYKFEKGAMQLTARLPGMSRWMWLQSYTSFTCLHSCRPTLLEDWIIKTWTFSIQQLSASTKNKIKAAHFDLADVSERDQYSEGRRLSTCGQGSQKGSLSPAERRQYNKWLEMENENNYCTEIILNKNINVTCVLVPGIHEKWQGIKRHINTDWWDPEVHSRRIIHPTSCLICIVTRFTHWVFLRDFARLTKVLTAGFKGISFCIYCRLCAFPCGLSLWYLYRINTEFRSDL